MEISLDYWLSEIFGYSVFRISNISDDSKICDVVMAHIRQQARAMYYAKINTSDVNILKELSSVDFYVVDTNVTFSRSVDLESDYSKGNVNVVLVLPEHKNEVLHIASSSFVYSRFHLDPLITKEIANRIKHDWVMNYFRKQRGDKLFVALKDGRPAGFLAAAIFNTGNKKTAVIELVGVGKEFQRQGIGKALVNHFVDHYKKECDNLQVGTQVANIPSMVLYENTGFFISDTKYVMHMHVKDGEVIN